jgi:tetratricopeptide (TPR) repeat protein
MAASISSNDRTAAEAALRRALELNPNSHVARRMLAGLLADRGGQQRWNEALQLLDGTADGDAERPQPVDQRLQALLLARRGGADNLARARRILQGLIADPRTRAANDRLLLAQILDAEGDSASAKKEYLSLASATEATQEQMQAYVDWMLRHDELKEAGEWLDKLDELAPDNTRTLALRVRWLYVGNQASDIEPLLERAAERLVKGGAGKKDPTAQQKLQSALTIGDLYQSVRNFAAAERWYRRACRLDPSQYGRLAQSLTDQQRIAEAVQLCVDAASHDSSSRPARALVDVLLRATPGPDDSAKAEGMLKQALKTHANDPQLLSPLATLRLMQQKLDEARRLFLHLLELQPDNVDALNDLAAVLAEQPGQAAEALQYVERAIELAGPQPNLLDTKGSILLSLGRFQEAVAILNIAASAPNPDPRYHFHLAVGHFRAGNLGRARESLTIARTHELTRQILTKSDTEWLAELDAQLH